MKHAVEHIHFVVNRRVPPKCGDGARKVEP